MSAETDWQFAFTRDLDLIRPAVCHETIYRNVVDDNAGPAEEFQPPEMCLYATVWQSDEYMGLFAMVPRSSIMADLHTSLLPKAWGKAVDIGRAFIPWAFANTQFRRFTGSIPECNRLALRMAKSCGMTEFGVNPASFLKNGKLHGLVMLGVSKEQ